jgi:hypothetical protein
MANANNEYESFMPYPDKWLQPDGSITTRDGTVIVGANESGAAMYDSFAPIPNKTILPDGSIGTFPSGGGGGGDFPPLPLPKALGTYNLQYQVTDEGVVSWIWGKVL